MHSDGVATRVVLDEGVWVVVFNSYCLYQVPNAHRPTTSHQALCIIVIAPQEELAVLQSLEWLTSARSTPARRKRH